MKNTETSLQIPPNMWQQIRQAMLANSIDNEETIGFLFCDRVTVSSEGV